MTEGGVVSPHGLPDSSDDAIWSLAPASASERLRGRDESSEQERLARLDSMDLEALRAMAVSMPVIEQAKGILMGCYGLDADTAFAVLRRVSSSGNLKLRALAVTVVMAASSQASSSPGPRPSSCEQVGRVIQSGLSAVEWLAT
jgi:hypothetical protein